MKITVRWDKELGRTYDQWGTHTRQFDRIEREYEVQRPQDAITRFFEEEMDYSLWDDNGNYRCMSAHGEPSSPKPERALMNWEKDSFAEVSDGYLTNMVAAYGNVQRDLEHTPEYCTRAFVVQFCPLCKHEMRERNGQWGAFYTCSCGGKYGAYTKKAASYRQITGFCGAPLVAMVNHNGCAYAGCSECHPDGDYERKPVGELVGYEQ